MPLTVSDALKTRHATRQFSDKPVREELLRDILELAGLAPSGGNLQPWKVHVLSGDPLARFVTRIGEHIQGGNMEQPEFSTYPSPLGEPFRDRRYACGERMYEALDIPREDKAGRIHQVLRNFCFFDAPVGIILTMKQDMSEAQALDVGIYAQSLMLLARERGLDTCPQLAWSVWPDGVRQALGLGDDEKVMIGIALGYADPDAPVNRLQQPRVSLDETTRIY